MRKTHLSLDVEHASASCLCDVCDGHAGGTVKVAGELGVFDEGVFCEEGLELVVGDEVVVFAVFFAWPGCAGGVCEEGRSEDGVGEGEMGTDERH